jgi:predicted Zn-dependent protease
MILVLGYLYRDYVYMYYQDAIEVVFPTTACSKPIQYTFGDFDTTFDISQSEFAIAVDKANSIWSSTVGKKLFEYVPIDNINKRKILKINLIYDYRQQATKELANIGIVIREDRASYEMLKIRYESILAKYKSDKIQIERDINAFNVKKKVFDDNVKYWNDRDGAPREEFTILENTKRNLNAEANLLNSRQKEFNETANTLNSIVTVLNQLVNKLNLNVNNYNTVGASAGEQFSEGEYIYDKYGERINIYQFEDRPQLVRVLAHELGHALGIDHVDNRGSIMYYLNQGKDEKLSEDDIKALNSLCKNTKD